MGNKQTLKAPNVPKITSASKLNGRNLITLKRTNSFNKKKEESTKNNILKFDTYSDYLRVMSTFKTIFIKYIPQNVNIGRNRERMIKQIENSYYKDLPNNLTMEKIFSATIGFYHRIGSIYGTSINYPKTELEKINFPLISKYVACNFENEDITNISHIVIKRINFLSEEFPFKLYHMIKTIKHKCCYVYGYDDQLNLNFFMEPYNADIEFISYIDYAIYITFIIEIVYPMMINNQFKLNDKFNIIINFKTKEPDTELISYLMNFLNNIYPLSLNIMHIVNYNINLLKKNLTFQENLHKIDVFNKIFFHNNKNYRFVLSNTIKPDMIPREFGGNADVHIFDFEIEDINELYEEFAQYLALNIFCDVPNIIEIIDSHRSHRSHKSFKRVKSDIYSYSNTQE